MCLPRLRLLAFISLTLAGIAALRAADEPSAPLNLFNGHDLTGLTVFVEGEGVTAADAWKIEDGLLRCTGLGRGYVRTTMAFADYRLRFEWRWPQGDGNSGILINMVNGDLLWPKGFEAQLRTGRAGDFASYADARSDNEVVSRNPRGVSTGRLNRPGPGMENPLGQWNAGEIVVAGDTITLFVNGTELNHLTGVKPSAGMIGFQSEGAAIDFRNITLTPLPPAKDLHAPMPP